MADGKQRKTFLSYSRVNKEFAIRLAKELKLEGFDIWLDQLDIPAGARWDREVERALRESDIFMIILTSASVDSENVLDEIGYAIDNSKRFLPVLLEPCNVPLRLRRFQYVDFTNKSFDDGVESAKELLRSLIAQDTIPRGVVVADLQAETDRKAREENERLAAKKIEEERLARQAAEEERAAMAKAEEKQVAKAKAETDRKAKEEADRLATQKAEAERVAKVKAEEERAAKAKAKEEADRLAVQKAEAERVAKVKADKERAAKAKAKEEADRLAVQKAEAERVAKVKADEERAAKAKAKEEADRLAAQKAEAERVAKVKADEERAAKAKAETDRKAKEEAERKKEKAANVPPVTKQPEPISSTSITQKKPMTKGLLYGIIGVVAVVVLGIAFSVMSSLSADTPAAVQAVKTQEPAVKVPTNTSKPAPTQKPKPTSTPKPLPTPTAGAQAFFTEEFEADFKATNWDYFIKGDGGNEFAITQEKDYLLFELGVEYLYLYYTYEPYIYNNVSLTLVAENRGRNNNTITLFCQLNDNETEWYEFNVESGGVWYLYAYKNGWNAIADGGYAGLQATNKYSLTCEENTLTAYINDKKVTSFTDNTYAFTEGRVGFNISSYNVLPITVAVHSFEIAEP